AAAAVVALATLFAFATDRALQSARLEQALELTEQERDRAQQERDAKKEVIDLMVDFFRFSDPNQSFGETLTVRQALDRSQTRLDLLISQPAVEATLRRAIGLIYLNLGEPNRAEPHLERAVEIRTQEHGEHSLEAALSRSEFGQVAWRRGDYPAARHVLQDAVDQVRRLRGDQHSDLIAPLNTLVAFLCWTEAYEDAAAPATEAFALAKATGERTGAEWIAALTHRAVIERQTGNAATALALYDQALDASIAWRGEVHPDTAAILNNLAVLWFEQGATETALATHHRALKARRKLYPDGHEEVAQSLHHLASIRAAQGDTPGAEVAFDEAFQMLLERYGAAHAQTARLALSLANLWLEEGQAKRTVQLLQPHLETWRKAFPGLHGGRAWIESTLGAAFGELGRYAQAESLLLQSQTVFEERYAPDHPRRRKNLERLLALHTARGDTTEASDVRRRLKN
ncbi:MAG: tetratricopeptide repeat protein, partial [Acidobacteriota bacterium]